MKNILFLDDNRYRVGSFLTLYPEARCTETAAGAIRLLQTEPAWNLVSLDHDLGGQVYVDSNREDCGMEVVRWICKNKPTIKTIIVHSWNIPASLRMVADLQKADYTAYSSPFSA